MQARTGPTRGMLSFTLAPRNENTRRPGMHHVGMRVVHAKLEGNRRHISLPLPLGFSIQENSYVSD